MSKLHLRWTPPAIPTTRDGVPVEVVDSIGVIAGVAAVIEDDWDRLSDADRAEIVATLRRRADHLRVSLSDHHVIRL